MNMRKPGYHRSTHREAILGYIRGKRAHLSAEEIYAALRLRFPRLSQGTVYRNLHILVDLDLLRLIHFGSGGDRYDARLDPHYHLVCRRCGEVRDVELGVSAGLEARAQAQADAFWQAPQRP